MLAPRNLLFILIIKLIYWRIEMEHQNLILCLSHQFFPTDEIILTQLVNQLKFASNSLESIHIFIENQACYAIETVIRIFSNFTNSNSIFFYLNQNHFFAFFSTQFALSSINLPQSFTYLSTDEFNKCLSEKIHLINTKFIRW